MIPAANHIPFNNFGKASRMLYQFCNGEREREMSEETNYYRRHFCGVGPSVAELVMIDTVDAHPSQTNPSNAITTKPGANTSFGALKEIDR